MILSFEQQQAILPISPNNQKKFPSIARDVDEGELVDMLGQKFKQTVDDHVNDEDGKFFELLNGGVLIDGTKFKGLKFIVAYLNYINYLDNSDVQDTFSGQRTQKIEQSDPLSKGRIENLKEPKKKVVFNQWDLLKRFINENELIFIDFNTSSTKRVYNPKATIIRNKRVINQGYKSNNW